LCVVGYALILKRIAYREQTEYGGVMYKNRSISAKSLAFRKLRTFKVGWALPTKQRMSASEMWVMPTLPD